MHHSSPILVLLAFEISIEIINVCRKFPDRNISSRFPEAGTEASPWVGPPAHLRPSQSLRLAQMHLLVRPGFCHTALAHEHCGRMLCPRHLTLPILSPRLLQPSLFCTVLILLLEQVFSHYHPLSYSVSARAAIRGHVDFELQNSAGRHPLDPCPELCSVQSTQRWSGRHLLTHAVAQVILTTLGGSCCYQSLTYPPRIRTY